MCNSSSFSRLARARHQDCPPWPRLPAFSAHSQRSGVGNQGSQRLSTGCSEERLHPLRAPPILSKSLSFIRVTVCSSAARRSAGSEQGGCLLRKATRKPVALLPDCETCLPRDGESWITLRLPRQLGMLPSQRSPKQPRFCCNF